MLCEISQSTERESSSESAYMSYLKWSFVETKSGVVVAKDEADGGTRS